MARRRAPVRDAAYHEAGHAVAQFFCPLAGNVTGLTIRKEDLPDGILGYAYSSHTLPSVRRFSVDHEQVRAECVVLLAGSEAEMRVRGDKLSGGSKDYDEVRDLLTHSRFATELEAIARGIPEEERATHSADELAAKYGPVYLERRMAVLDELCAEARDLLDEKWAHVEAVAKALYRYKTLSGDRVCEIIERLEEEG